MNQEAFGAAIGAHQTTVSNWETGKTQSIRTRYLDAIQRVTGIPVSWLRGKGSKESIPTPGQALSPAAKREIEIRRLEVQAQTVLDDWEWRKVTEEEREAPGEKAEKDKLQQRAELQMRYYDLLYQRRKADPLELRNLEEALRKLGGFIHKGSSEASIQGGAGRGPGHKKRLPT